MAPIPDFRPNPARSIFVQGQIDAALVRRLTPQIFDFQHQSRDPITIYIDSPGGSPDNMMDLLRVLKAPSQDSNLPCKIITVAVTSAFSAAADLLAFGDYALAYPHSNILFHGGRVPTATELTAEKSSYFAHFLRLNNESSALDLAREIELRFMFRFIILRGQFEALRNDQGQPLMSDLECFLHYIEPKLSTSAKKILNKARSRYKRYEQLVENVLRKKRQVKGEKTELEMEAIEIKAILDFEVKQNKGKAGWSFQHLGINSLTEDFLLFRGYQDVSQTNKFKRFCGQWGSFLVAQEITDQIEQIADANAKVERWTETVSPILQPIWSFFVALCHTLQQGEDDFVSAEDAYWLGLIDEVIGNENLIHLRVIRENHKDRLAQAAAEIPLEEVPESAPASAAYIAQEAEENT